MVGILGGRFCACLTAAEHRIVLSSGGLLVRAKGQLGEANIYIYIIILYSIISLYIYIIYIQYILRPNSVVIHSSSFQFGYRDVQCVNV